ncbi:MAG: GntR family transcriptional regulator [Mycoplasmataceae bacterium]|nr:GntR family transcriptional regulator [Mycoplasmataceae bacterium]
MSKPTKLANEIIKKINSGYFNKEHKFPSENSLSIEFGLSRTTVRKGLKILKDRDYIYSQKSKGYFISNSIKKLSVQPKVGKTTEIIVRKTGVNSLCKEAYQMMSNVGISRSIVEEKFSKNIFIKSYFSNNDKPFHIKVIFISNDLKISPTKEIVKNGVISLYNKYGVSISKRTEITTLFLPPKWMKEIMQLKSKELLPTVAAALYDSHENIIEASIEYWSPENFLTKHTIKY